MTPQTHSSGTLKDYFDGLTAAKVVAMKGTAQENHLIEFKTLVLEDFSDKNDKRNLAASMSAFSNSDGGIILWGVRASKDKNDGYIDQVTAADGLKNPKVALSRLLDLTATACSPFPIGVEHRIIKGRSASFVATYVPASDGGPHMAQLGLGKYYVRSGGSSIPMEHFQIADMFGRRAAPRLSLEAVDVNGFAFSLMLRNEGRGPAHAPYLQVLMPHPFRPVMYSTPFWPMTSKDRTWVFASDTTTVIHPTMDVTVMSFTIQQNPSLHDIEAARICNIAFKMGATGIAPVEGEMNMRLG